LNTATGLKRLAIALAALILAVGGGITAMSLLISADAAREQAKAEIRTVTGLDPIFGGPSTVSLFPFGVVTFEDVTLREGRETALTARRLTASLRFFPLLLGRVETGEIRLEQPTIIINVDEPGRSTWARLLDSLNHSPLADQETPSFSAIRIEDGRVIVRDRTHKAIEQFDHVALSLAWPSISKSFGATGQLEWHGQTIDASVTLADFSAALAGKPSGLKLRIGGAPGKVAFEGSISTQPTLKIAGTLAADSPSLRKALSWAGQKPLPGDGFERFALKADANVVGGTIALSGVNIELDKNRAEGVLAFAVDGRRTLQGTLAADSLDLRPYTSAIHFVSSSNRHEWSDSEIALDSMSNFDVDLRLSAASVLLSSAKLGRTAIAANLRGGNLSMTIGESQAFGGTIKGTITLANFLRGIDVKSELNFADVDLEVCLNQLFDIKRLEGKGNLTLAVEGSGESILAVTRTLTGSAALSGKSGALVGLNVEQLMRRLERRPLSAGAELHTGRTPYKEIAIALKIDHGKATVQDVKIEGPAVRLALGGSASIPSRKLDLTGTATLLTAAAKDGFELPFVVQGSWDDPVVLPDAQILIHRSGAAAPLLNAVRNRRARDAGQAATEKPAEQSPAASADATKPAE
jgi:AsmA protein